MKTYLIEFNGNITSVFFNEKSPLSGVRQYFKSNYPNLFKKYIRENRNGKLFLNFLSDNDVILQVVDHYDYRINGI